MRKLTLMRLLLLTLFCVTLFNSCRKSQEHEPEIAPLSKEEALFKWGQAHNGRWLPYVLNKIKEEHPNAAKTELIGLLDSYLNPINNAVAFYDEKAKTGTSETASQWNELLKQYYLENYNQINNSLALLKDMDRLYAQYQELATQPISASKIQNRLQSLGKRSNTDFDGVEITGCSIPFNLRYWIAWYFGTDFWSLHAIGVVRSTTHNETGDCLARLDAFFTAVIQLADKGRINSPTQADCDYYVSQAEQALAYYGSCPNKTGDSPGDPLPPGGGGSGDGSGGSTNPPTGTTHYSETEMMDILNNLEDPITGNGIELYLIANYKGSKLLDLTKFSTSQHTMVGDYTLKPHYDKNGTLVFYTATRLLSGNDIEYLVRADQFSEFAANIDYYRASADLFYMNGIPTSAMVKMLGGDRVEGLVNLWVDAIKSVEYWMYLATLYEIRPNNTSVRNAIDDVLPEGAPYTKSSLEMGRAMHTQYKAGLADGISTFKEYTGIQGIRPDFVDFNTRTIYELKPNNPRQITAGNAQLAKYKAEFERVHGGTWNTVLDLY